jgi:hypothetical protein
VPSSIAFKLIAVLCKGTDVRKYNSQVTRPVGYSSAASIAFSFRFVSFHMATSTVPQSSRINTDASRCPGFRLDKVIECCCLSRPARNVSLQLLRKAIPANSKAVLRFKRPFCNNLDHLCGQSSWLQIRGPGFDSRHYQIFWKKKTVVGLERGPVSLVSTTEELLDRKVAPPV